MNDSRSPLEDGTALRGGDFAIESPLGMGGFGITYRAHDHRLKRLVAVKEFFPQGSLRQSGHLKPGSGWTEEDLEAQRDRFLQEGRILARLRHPGIPIVFDIFEENETAYLVMEFIEGQTLAQYMVQRNVWFLPPHEALTLIRGAGEALNLMHEAQLLHRDLKPTNIMRRFDGQVMLIDFGASRDFLPETVHTMTVILTAGYAPLEQYTRSGNYGPYTDVYSLAATLYYLLTGKKPLDVLWRATGEVLPSPNQVNPLISPTLSNAVMHGLEVPPAQRPATVAAFLRELTDSQAGEVEDSCDDTVAVAPAPVDAFSDAKLQINPNKSLVSPSLSSPSKLPASRDSDPSEAHRSPLFDISPAYPSPPSLSNIDYSVVAIPEEQSFIPATIAGGLKVVGWTGLGAGIGLALGAFISHQVPLSHNHWRRIEAVWYMQLNVSLLLAMWLGRRSYVKEKRLRLKRLGKVQVLDPSKFNRGALSSIWEIATSWLWLAVLRGEYLVVTRGKHDHPRIREAVMMSLIVWSFLCICFFIYRVYRNKPLGL